MPEKIRHKLSPKASKTCESCPLKDNINVDNQVTTEYYGKPPFDVMFIAEGPGASENSQGRPFIGRTGRIIRRLVSQVGGGNKGFAFANIVRCRPTRVIGAEIRDRAPNTREINACKPNILRDIKKLKPKAIVILGDSAAKGLATYLDGNPLSPKESIAAIRGKDYFVNLPDGTRIPATVTYHFSHVLHHPNTSGIFREDVSKIIRRVRGAIPNDYGRKGDPAVILDTVPKVKKFLRHLIKGLSKDDVVAFDYETASLQRIKSTALTVSFAYGPDKAYVIPLDHVDTPFRANDQKKVKALLRKFFCTKKVSFKALVAHNLKFEQLITLDQFGTHIAMPTGDTQQRAHALNEDRKSAHKNPYGLKVLVQEHLGFYHYEDEGMSAVVSKVKSEKSAADTPLQSLAEYNAMDAYVTWRLHAWQDAWAKAEGYYDEFDRLSYTLHRTVVASVAEMEHNGMKANIDQLRALYGEDSEVNMRMNAIGHELAELDNVKEANDVLRGKSGVSGGGIWGDQGRKSLWVFEMNKVAHKQALFFDVMKLDPVNHSRKNKTPSLDEAFWKKYAGVTEVDLYEEYTNLRKITSTYVKGLHECLHSAPDMMYDLRVRPNYKPTGTITGRLSCADPNLLNIPTRKKDDATKAIKRMYIVDDGKVMVCADYSQAEVRWLAEMSQDPDLIKAFNVAYQAKKECQKNPTTEMKRRSKYEGDFHRHTASMVNNVPIDKVTPEQRQNTKAVVFGLVYGQTTRGLADKLGISEKEASAFVDSFFARFPAAQAWLDDQELEGFRTGRVISPTGRRKLIHSWLLVGGHLEDTNRLPNHLKKVKSYVNHEMRVCRNAPIQGVASDMTLTACYRILDYILTNKRPWKIVNTVYDSVMIEVPFSEAAECIEVSQGIMEDPDIFSDFGIKPKVPFAADFSVGVNWGDQMEIAYDEEEWKVTCTKCGSVRKEKKRPTNRRCEDCGSKKVRRSIVTGPQNIILKQLDRDHSLSEVA